MFGKLGDMMGKLQKMKHKAEEIKGKLAETTLKIDAAGGDIKIEISGDRRIKELLIASALQHGDREELQKQLTAAFNKAMEAADKLNEDEMKRAAGGLLPGF